MAKRPPTIPDSELDVLKVLWDRGESTVREVLETLRAAVKDLLPAYMAPREVVAVDALPRTQLGKVQRKRLS